MRTKLRGEVFAAGRGHGFLRSNREAKRRLNCTMNVLIVCHLSLSFMFSMGAAVGSQTRKITCELRAEL